MSLWNDLDEFGAPLKKDARRASREADWLPRNHVPSDGEAIAWLCIGLALALYGLGSWLF